MDLELSYTDLKEVIDAKKLPWQYVESTEKYFLFAVDLTVTYFHSLWKAGHESEYTDVEQNTANLAEFEELYKALANKPVAITSSPFAANTFQFSGKGIHGVAAAGETTNIDLKLEDARHLNGGIMCTEGSVFGDHITCQVVDKDNVLGYGEGVVINQWIDTFYVVPDDKLEITLPMAAKIPADLYLRLQYKSTGILNVKVLVNYFLHKDV